MEVCYWALLFMPLVILHQLLNVFVQLANKSGFKPKKFVGCGCDLHKRLKILALKHIPPSNTIILCK
jgi:hypothetical protein